MWGVHSERERLPRPRKENFRVLPICVSLCKRPRIVCCMYIFIVVKGHLFCHLIYDVNCIII